MRKMLKNKKGFTLVELMIVVVIMGILVAVAIPIYNSVTKGVEKSSCEANMRIIEENFNAFQMTGNNGGSYTWSALDGDHPITAEALTDADGVTWTAFAGMFKDGLPTCPTDGAAYTLTVDGTNNTYTVTCNCAEEGIDHNAE